jgi:hypothetical protein
MITFLLDAAYLVAAVSVIPVLFWAACTMAGEGQ